MTGQTRPLTRKIPPVRRLRLFFACLLLLALPLQGIAAAMKLSCLAHESGAAVASHAHADADGAAHHHSDDSAANHESGDHGAKGANHHADVSCSVCAACCHGAMKSETATVPRFSAPSHAVPTPLAVAMLLRAVPPPDKPPRA